MKEVFYFMVLLLALYELAIAINYKIVYMRVNEYNKLNEDSQTGYIAAHPMLLFMMLIDIIGLLLITIGLFTSQWFYFLLVMLLSLCRLYRLGAWAVCLDSIITILIYVFAVLNTFRLHLTLF